MITQINSLEDVVQFAKLLDSEKVSFHPDDDFADYVDLNTRLPFYTSNDAELRNKLMNTCFEICDFEKVDIYEIMQESCVINERLF